MSLPFDLRSINKQTLFSNWEMAPALRKSGQSTPQKAQHLVVLVHGLWGNPGHLDYVAKSLRDRYGDEELVVLACRRNLGSLTYE
jgi:myosin-crossreactive antigen